MRVSKPVSEVHEAPEVLIWLFGRQRFGVELGLERMRALLKLLGEPQARFETVLVGGTNGKGSVSSTLASILTHAGRRTGLFTSPHLSNLNERFRVSGLEVAEPPLLAALGELRPHAEALGATFFEILTALGCVIFARSGVEVAVMEVGLGGRFDATNVLSPRLSIVTGVSKDHTEVLGDTVTAIATEKAGIMRAGRLCLSGATGEARTVLEREAAALGVTLWILGRELKLRARDRRWAGSSLSLESPAGTSRVQTPLLGAHQGRNVALAVAAAQALGVTDEIIRRGVQRARWPGRLEPIRFGDRRFLLDGAHNPEAAAALAETLTRLKVAPARLIFGASQDKALAEMVACLEPCVLEVIVTRAVLSPRSSPPEALAELWRAAGCSVQLTQTPQEAVYAARSSSERGDTVVVAGSLYLIGEVRPLLLGQAAPTWTRLQ